MLCQNKLCTQEHVLNPTTSQCVEKKSYLGKMILNSMSKENNSQTILKKEEEKNIFIEFEKLKNEVKIILEKQNQSLLEIIELLSEIQENLEFVPKVEPLDLNETEEEMRIIQILKDEFKIISSSDKENPINGKIKSFLTYVRGNIEKGKRTMVTKDLISKYFN